MSPATGSAAALFQSAQLLAAQSVTGVVTPAGVDFLDYDGLFHVTQNCGAQVGGTLTGKIQSSPDNSVWTDVTGATFTGVTTGNQVQSLTLDSAMCQRYIRWTNTFAGTSILVAVTISGIKKIR
jgi:hypothetical protein